jgi:hypothetical protein
MKELSFEKMEEVHGGEMNYCDLICYWYNGGAGYQGTDQMLAFAAYTYCGGCA